MPLASASASEKSGHRAGDPAPAEVPSHADGRQLGEPVLRDGHEPRARRLARRDIAGEDDHAAGLGGAPKSSYGALRDRPVGLVGLPLHEGRARELVVRARPDELDALGRRAGRRLARIRHERQAALRLEALSDEDGLDSWGELGQVLEPRLALVSPVPGDQLAALRVGDVRAFVRNRVVEVRVRVLRVQRRGEVADARDLARAARVRADRLLDAPREVAVQLSRRRRSTPAARASPRARTGPRSPAAPRARRRRAPPRADDARPPRSSRAGGAPA